MKFFRETTKGHKVVMGRATWESLPVKLKDRKNIVVTRSDPKSLEKPLQAPAVAPDEVVSNLDGFIKANQDSEEEIFIIGGASVYRQAIAIADRLCLTEVNDTPAQADAFFPAYDDWRVEKSEPHEKDEKHTLEYAFVDYVK